MGGKDFLAILLMIVPGLLLIALIALTLVPASVSAPPAGAGPQVKAQTPTPTQKRMRDPWTKPVYADSSK